MTHRHESFEYAAPLRSPAYSPDGVAATLRQTETLFEDSDLYTAEWDEPTHRVTVSHLTQLGATSISKRKLNKCQRRQINNNTQQTALHTLYTQIARS